MIARDIKRFCKDFIHIENYDKAINDNTQSWVCHHKLETHNSDGEKRSVFILPQELEALGMYYDRPANEFIFLTRQQHIELHSEDKSYMQTEEYKRKVSEAKKKAHVVTPGSTGMHWYNNGTENICAFECPEGFVEGRLPYKTKVIRKPFSEETKKKMSESHKGYVTSEETKKKLSLNSKGRKWYNNGEISVMRFECPNGFVLGRLVQKKK